MKKIIYLLSLSLFVFTSCNQENEIIDLNLKTGKTEKISICHYDANTGTWKTMSINGNALNPHLRHGDIQLIDKDGDGWVEMENECVPGGDCNDMDPLVNPGVEEICGNSIDDDCDGEIDEDCRTYVPDDNFEQFLINEGYDDVLDDYVLTDNINTITSILIESLPDPRYIIEDFTGLEDFISLQNLTLMLVNVNNLNLRPLTSLTKITIVEDSSIRENVDFSNDSLTEIVIGYVSFPNTNLTFPNNPSLNSVNLFDVRGIASVDFSNNLELENLQLDPEPASIPLTSINLLNNLNLNRFLLRNVNGLEALDLSNNTGLTDLRIYSTRGLSNLNLKNGNNTMMSFFAETNPDLTCIEVDDADWSTANWIEDYVYAEDCGY